MTNGVMEWPRMGLSEACRVVKRAGVGVRSLFGCGSLVATCQ